MTWSQYVARTCGDDQGRDFEAKTGIDGSTLSRWRRGDSGGLRADKVAAFARGYSRPVLEAFVEAGFISAAEAGAAPPGKPDLSAITNEELVELIRHRLEQRAGGEHEQRSAPIATAEQQADVVTRDSQGRTQYLQAKDTPTGLRTRLEQRLQEARTGEERRKVEQLLADLDRIEETAAAEGAVSDVS